MRTFYLLQVLNPDTVRRFISSHFKVVEVKALLVPADGFLDAALR